MFFPLLPMIIASIKVLRKENRKKNESAQPSPITDPSVTTMEASPDSLNPPIAAVASGTGKAAYPQGSVQEPPPAHGPAALLAGHPNMSHSSSTSSITLVTDDEQKGMSENSLPRTGVELAQLSTAESEANNPPDQPEKSQRKPLTGWRDEYPFDIMERKNQKDFERPWISWSKLTLREKYEYRKHFLREYISETRKCLPYVKRLFITVYRISPWRATLLLFLNLVNGLLPAMTMQTKGNFLILVFLQRLRGEADVGRSYKKVWKMGNWIPRSWSSYL